MVKPKRVLFHLERAIRRVEESRISARLMVPYFLGCVFLRGLLERIFFEKAGDRLRHLHHLFFFVFVFLSGIVIIHLTGKIAVEKVARIACLGAPLIVIPPLVDHFVFLRRFPYDYILPRELGRGYLTFFQATEKAGPGLAMEIGGILFLAVLYVLIRTRSWPRAVLTAVSLYVLIGLAVTPRIFMPFLPPSSDPGFQSAHHLIYFGFYFCLSLVLGLVFMFRLDRNLAVAVGQEVLSFRTVHFLLLVGLGLYWRGVLPRNLPNALFVLYRLLLMVFLWLSTVLQNHIHDLPIDRISNPRRPLVTGQVQGSSYRALSFIFGLLALLLACSLSAAAVFLTVSALVSSWAYSAPPLRLRKRLFSTVFIGWGSVVAFFIGYFGRTRIKELSVDHRTLSLAMVIFSALSLGPLVKDLKDYEGDKQAGVKTFFTVFEISRGTKIVSLLLGISLLTPVLLFHELADIIFFGCLAALTAWLFYARGRADLSRLGYGAAVLYGFLRITRII
jgi:4-hydroxybenzoate polyprenyltransferase